jgi:hypothetical protein
LDSSLEKNSQPFIVCATETPSTQGKGEYYVVVDRTAIKTGANFLRAMEIMYKAHHVFNLTYPVKLKTFFTFMEAYIFKFCNAKPTVSLENYIKKLKQ